MLRGNVIDMQWPTADVERFFAVLRSIPEQTGKSAKQAMQWGAVKLCDSLAASTKVSAKQRKIVENPLFKTDPSARMDARRARFGVMKYQRDGSQKFVPIYRGGEFGARMKFISRDKVALQVGNHWEIWDAGTNAAEFQIPGLEQHPKRKIGRRGMAKRVWQWAKANTIRGGAGAMMGVPDVASIRWRGGEIAPEITIADKLRYAVAAFNGGRQPVESAFGRAAAGLENRLEKAVEDQLKKAATA